MVFFMQAGFAMLEAGSLGSTSVVNILFKNMCDSMLGAIIYFAFGYALSYGMNDDTGKFFGNQGFFLYKVNICEYADFFYQFTFAATATTIVSGSMAGRTKLSAYL